MPPLLLVQLEQEKGPFRSGRRDRRNENSLCHHMDDIIETMPSTCSFRGK
jgi:hypothetical protein